MTPPKPAARHGRLSLWRYARAFREDILSAQPARLYEARMAEFRTPFFRSFLLGEPHLVDIVLKQRPEDFPKSDRVTEGLRPLLGDAVFVTNGAAWARQRRIMDPAFGAARIPAVLPAMRAAAEAGVARLGAGRTEIESWASHVAADVIFRTLFSIPIEDRVAQSVYAAFRTYQRSQPILNLGALLPLPRWAPRFHRARTRAAGREIRALIAGLVEARLNEIREGRAPDDLATRLLTARDPETGETFGGREMVDQVAIFFLAGHETSAAALSWALYLLATHPAAQERVAAEGLALNEDPEPGAVPRLPFTRDVFRETLRLYPPVPMMVREARCPERFRDRPVPRGSQIVISPWHLHRNGRYWSAPDGFEPERWAHGGEAVAKAPFLPFSAGPRVCPGAAFAMVEGPLILALAAARWRFAAAGGEAPCPVAHLTVRSRTGIFLDILAR